MRELNISLFFKKLQHSKNEGYPPRFQLLKRSPGNEQNVTTASLWNAYQSAYERGFSMPISPNLE
jgi:hypothetical protein